MLILPIKEKWFNMIFSGEKHEEYRADTPYYDSRFERYTHSCRLMPVAFRNGYSSNSPTLYCLVRPTKRMGARPAWGGDPMKKCWVLRIFSCSKEAPDDFQG